MIRGFWQSKLAFCAVALASAGLAVAVWIRDQGYPVYIPILATCLMLAIGLISAKLLGNVVANSQNTKALGLLHVDMDPQAFLAAYGPVPGRLPKESRSYAVACAYLADGYAAAGQFDKAMETLCPRFMTKKGEDSALKGLYYNNMCAYALNKGDLDRAREAMAALDEVVNENRLSNPALSGNMAQSLRLYQNRLAVLTGEKVEEDWLEDLLSGAQYKLRRMEIAQTLAQSAVNRKDEAAARKYLRVLSRESGRTWYNGWASREENRLHA